MTAKDVLSMQRFKVNSLSELDSKAMKLLIFKPSVNEKTLSHYLSLKLTIRSNLTDQIAHIKGVMEISYWKSDGFTNWTIGCHS